MICHFEFFDWILLWWIWTGILDGFIFFVRQRNQEFCSAGWLFARGHHAEYYIYFLVLGSGASSAWTSGAEVFPDASVLPNPTRPSRKKEREPTSNHAHPARTKPNETLLCLLLLNVLLSPVPQRTQSLHRASIPKKHATLQLQYCKKKNIWKTISTTIGCKYCDIEKNIVQQWKHALQHSKNIYDNTKKICSTTLKNMHCNIRKIFTTTNWKISIATVNITCKKLLQQQK